MKKYAYILLLFVTCSCSSFKDGAFKELHTVKINEQSSFSGAYTKERLNDITKVFIVEYEKRYGDLPDGVFNNVMVYIYAKPVNGNYGEVGGGANMLTIQLWANTPDVSDSAYIHELIHIARYWAAGDPDNGHTGPWWGEGLESPVKRGSKLENRNGEK